MTTIINTYNGNNASSAIKVGIVASEFNNDIVERLLQDAKKTLLAHQIDNVTIVRVPGAFELSFAARQLADNHDVIIVLGVVIRGETPHFDTVCQACVEGITRVIHDKNIPVVFGVLTTNTVEQALARANGTANDDQTAHQSQGGGTYAAITALRMANLAKQLQEVK